MGEPNNIKEIAEFIIEVGEKIDKFASILEKFGLDLITKIGQTNMRINMLTDKIDEVSKATIDIKSLTPQLTNVIENQKILEAELDLIRSLIQRSDITFHSREAEGEKIERDESATDKKETILGQFNALIEELNDITDPTFLIERLENLKEDIFIYKGGHRILYEIAQFGKILNGQEEISDDLRNKLKEKIVFWINKL
jgi:hypothetical protein